MSGMTLKQFARQRFLLLLEQYRDAAQHISDDGGQERFIAVSIHLHAASGSVPRSWRAKVRRAYRRQT